MFPKIYTDKSAENEEASQSGKSFLFDFEQGDFAVVDGKVKLAEGIEGVKVWIRKVLATEKFKFKIYETEGDKPYGVRLKDFINGDYPIEFTKIEIEREIREVLARNADITSVKGFSFEKSKRNLICKFTVETVYGETGGEVFV